MTSVNGRKDWWIAFGWHLVDFGARFRHSGGGRRAAMGEAISISITSDTANSAINLDCSGDEHFGTIHCAFDAAGKPQPGQKPLRPYVTLGRELILLSGVFEDTSVSGWLLHARQTGSQARVTLNCQASLLGKLSKTAVRSELAPHSAPERDVTVAKVSNCQVAP